MPSQETVRKAVAKVKSALAAKKTRRVTIEVLRSAHARQISGKPYKALSIGGPAGGSATQIAGADAGPWKVVERFVVDADRLRELIDEHAFEIS